MTGRDDILSTLTGGQAKEAAAAQPPRAGEKKDQAPGIAVLDPDQMEKVSDGRINPEISVLTKSD